MRERAKLLLGVALVGCTSSVDENVETGLGVSYISFTPMYSAFDGTHDYAVTPSVPGAAPSKDADPLLASSIKWQLDGAFVRQEEFPDLPAAIKLTTKKDGVTTVAMTAKSLSGHAIRGEAQLTISRATPSEWDAGEARYNNGAMNEEMTSAMAADGIGMCGLVFVIDLPKSSACSTCHTPMSGVTIEPSPTQTAGYSNEDLINIFTRAAKPAYGIFHSQFLRSAPMPDCLYKSFHTWEMTDDEKKGIIWKLRSIPPKVLEAQ